MLIQVDSGCLKLCAQKVCKVKSRCSRKKQSRQLEISFTDEEHGNGGPKAKHFPFLILLNLC